jgi:cellulose synthase/poly-beta-1,6-N-acetylglucosamine synthase-like glycosyltransferase
VYDTTALTEDNELTLALKTLGWKVISPRECVVHTEVMPTWRRLWHQRLRWQRGALENLRHYGLTRTTAPYLWRQFLTALGAIVFGLLCGLTINSVTSGVIVFNPFWTALTAVFLTERMITVRSAGRRAVLLSCTLIPEILFDVFLMAVYLKAVGDVMRRAGAEWQPT